MSDTPMRFEQYRRRFEPAIRRTIEQVAEQGGLGKSSLGRMLGYQMDTGGKRIRAVLPLMVAEALGEDPESMVAFGACCELIHNATLVHDDLQDGDRVRRGEPTVWVKFGSAEAINLGDAMLMLAPRCLEHVDVEEALRWRISHRIARRVLDVVAGQQQEFELTVDAATLQRYEQMVAGKTSGLFALPMVETARLCGADEAVVHGLEEAAHPLGVLFQIQDDILDLYGQKGRGRRGEDIREGKISALVVAFVQKGSDEDVQRLTAILQADRDETTDEDVRWASQVFRRDNAVDEAIDRIVDLRDQALGAEGLQDHLRLRGLIEEICDVVVEPIADVCDGSPFAESEGRQS